MKKVSCCACKCQTFEVRVKMQPAKSSLKGWPLTGKCHVPTLKRRGLGDDFERGTKSQSRILGCRNESIEVVTCGVRGKLEGP